MSSSDNLVSSQEPQKSLEDLILEREIERIGKSVTVLLKSVGSTPTLAKNKFKMGGDKKIKHVMSYLKNALKYNDMIVFS